MVSRFLIFLLTSLFATSAFAQQAPKVLAELFSNTNCNNCKTPDEQFGSFIANNPQYGVVRISYHNDVSNVNDTFYQASLPASSIRSSAFYNVQTDPTAAINGTVLANNVQAWEALAKSNATTDPNIQLSARNAGDSIIIHVTNKAQLSKSVRLYVALTESHIVMANTLAYGVPTSGYWDDVFRDMLPTGAGTDAFTPTGNDVYDVSFTPPTPDLPDATGHVWNTQNMKVVAFIQDDQANPTKKVEALGVISLANLGVNDGPSVASSASIRVAGNPTSPELRVSLPASQHARVVLSDLLGRTVGTLYDGNLPDGESTVEFAKSAIPAGCYIARLFVAGNETAHTKLIVP